MKKTMTDNVINEFKKAFKEAGLTRKGISCVEHVYENFRR